MSKMDEASFHVSELKRSAELKKKRVAAVKKKRNS